MRNGKERVMATDKEARELHELNVNIKALTKEFHEFNRLLKEYLRIKAGQPIIKFCNGKGTTHEC